AGSACWFTAMALEPVAQVRTLGLIELYFSYVVSRRVFRERLGRTGLLGLILLAFGLVGVVGLRWGICGPRRKTAPNLQNSLACTQYLLPRTIPLQMGWGATPRWHTV